MNWIIKGNPLSKKEIYCTGPFQVFTVKPNLDFNCPGELAVRR